MTDALPVIPPTFDAVSRWQAIVERRRAQMDAVYAEAGMSSADYWARRAAAYRKSLHERVDQDPFFMRVQASVSPESEVLDVGAGTGRHTLALAPHVRRVVAVDPSEAMLSLLRQDVAAAALSNVEAIHADWMSAQLEPADAVICSHVLYPIADVVPFIRKLETHARGRVWIYIRVDPLATDLGLWKEFHGIPLQDQPTFVDLYPVLLQMGVVADVEVVEHRFTLTYASVDEAVAQVRNGVCLREDDEEGTARLRALLERLLTRTEAGRYGPPIESARSAIISWARRT